MSAQSPKPVDCPESNLIVTDNQSMALALQQALARLGENGPRDNVVSLDDAAEAAQSCRHLVRRVLVDLGTDASKGLAVVRMIREIIPVSLYVVGPRDAGLILNAVHAGADNFIEDFDPLDEYLAKALSRPNANGKLSAEAKVICVSSVRGGCGASVIAVNLAAAMAQRLKRAALCDFDLQNGVCDALLNLKPKHTILDLHGRVERLDRNSIESALTRHQSGVHLLPAPVKPIDGHLETGDLCQRVLRTIRQMFPVVIADLPRFTSEIDVEALLSACNKFVLVTLLDFNSIRSTRRTLDSLARAGIPSQRIQLVGNREGQPNVLSVAHAEQALDCKISHFIPDDSKTVNRSINCGTPFYPDSAGSRLAKAFDLLADSLFDEFGFAQPESDVKPHALTQRPTKFADSLHHWGDWLLNRRTNHDATT